MIPEYKKEYMSSVGLLYRQLQDIEIYVEDEDSEVFYTQLFSRLLDGYAKIKKIIPLGGRKSVLEAEQSQKRDSAKVFVIDGDLYWSSQTFDYTSDRLYIHDSYCVENILFCPNAASKLIQETIGNISIEDARKLLDWEKWTDEISPSLIRLFILFSVAFKLKPSIKTTKRGFTSIISNTKKQVPKLDIDRLEKQYSEVLEELKVDYSEYVIEEEIKKVLDFAESKGIKIVSGKDFLVPLMCFKVKEACGLDLSVNSRNFRLASHCDLTPLEGLRSMVVGIIDAHKSQVA